MKSGDVNVKLVIIALYNWLGDWNNGVKLEAWSRADLDKIMNIQTYLLLFLRHVGDSFYYLTRLASTRTLLTSMVMTVVSNTIPQSAKQELGHDLWWGYAANLHSVSFCNNVAIIHDVALKSESRASVQKRPRDSET